MDSIHHLVVGAGPVGSTAAVRLAELGHRVTVLSRSGGGPAHEGVNLVAGDATDIDTLVGLLDGSGALVNAANPAYHRWPRDWPPLHHALCAAAERSGALLVVMDNLYAYGAGAAMPMREDSPLNPTGRKGAVRAGEGDLGIIPGSMGARSYIVRGKGNADSFHSCSHGAGRAMSRGEASRRFTLADHRAATEGVECRKDKEVIDETPAAYKSIDAVMAAQTELVDIVHTLKQVVCVKG